MICPLALDIDPLPTADSPWALLDEALVKAHCAIDDDDFDAQLRLYIKAAVEWAEGQTHRSIYARTHRWVLSEFPYGDDQSIWLPRGKTRSVTSIVYSSGGSPVTLRGPSSGSPAGTDWLESLRGDGGGVLMPPQGECWPSADCDVPEPVVITFEAGWQPDEVPADLVHAMLFAVSDMYELRGTDDFTPGVIAAGGANLSVREALIGPYRLHRWY